MAPGQIGLIDVHQGLRPSKLRILAPLRYLLIANSEKLRYDFILPSALGIFAWSLYMFMDPRPPLFGEAGIFKYTRDLLVMAVPFMIGALATVSMGAPGNSLDRRIIGAELYLDGKALNLRQFVCYLLGYLSFLGIAALGFSTLSEVARPTILAWIGPHPHVIVFVRDFGAFLLSMILSSLTVTVFWSIYFLTDIVNRQSPSDKS